MHALERAVVAAYPIVQDCVREKYTSLRHYASYSTFATMLFNNCSVLKEHAVRKRGWWWWWPSTCKAA